MNGFLTDFLLCGEHALERFVGRTCRYAKRLRQRRGAGRGHVARPNDERPQAEVAAEGPRSRNGRARRIRSRKRRVESYRDAGRRILDKAVTRRIDRPECGGQRSLDRNGGAIGE